MRSVVNQLWLLGERSEIDQKLESRVQKGLAILNGEMRGKDDFDLASHAFRKWDAYNVELLSRLFSLDRIASEYEGDGTWISHDGRLESRIVDLRESLLQRLRCLDSIRERLDLIPVSVEKAVQTSETRIVSVDRTAVFVVHGHDDSAREQVARFLEKLGLTAVILHEQASRGGTIIEKLERHASVGFAVVLLTPDDACAPKRQADHPRPRARQNVVLELGFFLGKLGRDRVCALHKGPLEFPSNMLGVVSVEMDDRAAWRVELAKELRAAGYSVDLNLVL